MKKIYNNNILVTGSSGYVASDLIPRLKEGQNVWGLDLLTSLNTDFKADIGDKQNLSCLEALELGQLIVVNLAAARFDFGATADDYFKLNVKCHEKFLESLVGQNIKKFIHINLIYYKSNKGTVNTDLPDTLNLNFQATRVLKRNEF